VIVLLRRAYFPAFFLGLVTALTQTVLIREIMIATGAFELVVAVALSLWMLFTGTGGLLFGHLPFLRRPIATMALILLLAAVGIAQLFFVHPLAGRFAAVAGAALSIPAMIAVAALILLPGCLLGGLAFPACVAAARKEKNPAGLIYLIESSGMAAGALLFYLFLEFFSPVRYALFFDRYATRYPSEELVLSRDGHYGRLDITRRGDQKTYFWNGQAAGVAGNSRPVEEFSGLALTQHPAPRRVVVIGGLLSGTAAEMARRMPRTTVTIIEQEPLLMESEPAKDFRSNATLRIGEPTAIIAALPPQDLIILDLPDPTSITLSRFFSREFFQFIREHTGPSAVLVVGLSGGRGMLPPELAALNRSVQQALEQVFRTVALIPAARHLWVAADNNLPTTDVAVIAERMERNQLNGGWFTEASVRDIFEPMHRQLTMAAVEKASAETNRLLRPVAYLETLRHTARRLDEPLPSLFVTLPDHPILFILISGVLVLFCAISIAFPTRRQLSPAQSIAIFSASGSAFLFQIALMSLLQVYSGQIYHFLAFFTISFMAGITGGSLLSRVKTISSLLSLGALALLSAGILLSAAADLGAAGYISLNAIAGILLGITMGNLARSSDTERSPGAAFYVADLAGAALCGLFFGAAMLPLFDLRLSLAVAGGLALIGMFALNKDRSRNNDF